MTLKTLFISTALAASALFARSAHAQYGYSGYGSTGIGVNFGGSYSKTVVTGPNGQSASVSNTFIGGSIGMNSVGGYGGGYGYGGYGGYYGGYGYTPCVPVYSPFTRCYGAPYYPAAVITPYYGGCAVPVYPVYGGQFIVR